MLRDICAKLYELDIKEVPLRHITQLLCLFCPGFGKSCRCPPNTWTVNTTRTVLQQFEYCFVYVVYVELYNTNMRAVNSHMFAIGRRLVKLAKQVRDTIVLPPGAGRTCRECTVAKGGSCSAREKIPPSPEAVGVDVIALLTRLGLPVEIPVRRYVACTALILTRRRSEVERLLSVYGSLPEVESAEKKPLHTIPGAVPYEPASNTSAHCSSCPLHEVCRKFYIRRIEIFARELAILNAYVIPSSSFRQLRLPTYVKIPVRKQVRLRSYGGKQLVSAVCQKLVKCSREGIIVAYHA